MASSYERTLATAQRVIKAKGALCAYAMPANDPGDNPWFPQPGVDTIVSDYIVVTNTGETARYFKYQFREETIVGALTALMAPGKLSREPAYRDKITLVNGEEWYVKNVDVIAPGPIAVLYALELMQ